MPTHKICPDGDTTITLTTTKNPTKLLVSSHHLINASPYYRALLTGPFREASILRANGTVDITLPDNNPTAMITVMNAVHGRFFSVPGRKIKLELLKDIAVVVDKYELFESVSTVLHTWASTVRIGNPRASLRDVAKWILCVSWVFNMSDAFRFATKELVLDTGVDVELEGTCVPLNVGARITRRRATLLQTIRSRIQRFRDAEYQHSTVCTAYCDDLVHEKLDEILELLSRGPRSGVKPRTIRKMVRSLYENRMDGHQVVQNCANRYVYVPPLCIRLLEDLDMDLGWEFNRMTGMILGRYKGDAKRRVDWMGVNAGLDAKALWPYGQHPEAS